jgi:hypothetical protein
MVGLFSNQAHGWLLFKPSPCIRLYDAQVGQHDPVLLGGQCGVNLFFFDLKFPLLLPVHCTFEVQVFFIYLKGLSLYVGKVSHLLLFLLASPLLPLGRCFLLVSQHRLQHVFQSPR